MITKSLLHSLRIVYSFHSPPATEAEALRLRNNGVTVFSVGVGSGVNTAELNKMATDPDNQHVFVVNNFDALKGIKGALAQKACEGDRDYIYFL